MKRREDFASEREFLQVATLALKEGEEVTAHKHMENVRKITITQEFVTVVSGILEVNFYDIDDSLIKTIRLEKGDCYATFRGGHSIKALEESKIYEIKNGPYEGKEKDKIGI